MEEDFGILNLNSDEVTYTYKNETYQCGAVNRGLYLEETDGWMECEKCGNVTQSMEHRQTVKI